MSIAKIKRVHLREVWKHEALDFTQWLEENIEILGEAMNREIANAEREKKTESAFSIDLVAHTTDGTSIIVENQLEKSDHDHLGKLITYMTAMQASTAVWIVADPRPEHVAAITWLNESSSADFYLMKIEAIQIEDSPKAPLLTVIVGPSEEGNSIARSKQELSERYHIRQKWWSKLVRHTNATRHSHITPGKYAWIGTSSGVPGVSLNYVVWQKESAAELYIDCGKGMDNTNVRIFDHLYAQKKEIENSFGRPLTWESLEGKRACRIRVTVQGGYTDSEEVWKKTHDLMTDAMNRLVSALDPHLKSLKVESTAALEAK